MSDNNVRLQCGASEMNVSRANGRSIIGQTVSDVLRDEVFREYLSLAGNEGASVSNNGGNFVEVSNSYVLRAGDSVSFSKTSGGKG